MREGRVFHVRGIYAKPYCTTTLAEKHFWPRYVFVTRALIENLKKLDAESLEHIAAIVKEMVKDE